MQQPAIGCHRHCILQDIAKGQACSPVLETIPNVMQLSSAGPIGWQGAVDLWLSGNASYDYSSPGESSAASLAWSQASGAGTRRTSSARVENVCSFDRQQ
jgi:hypothetical protein